jgi:hypothetical protein
MVLAARGRQGSTLLALLVAALVLVAGLLEAVLIDNRGRGGAIADAVNLRARTDAILGRDSSSGKERHRSQRHGRSERWRSLHRLRPSGARRRGGGSGSGAGGRHGETGGRWSLEGLSARARWRWGWCLVVGLG